MAALDIVYGYSAYVVRTSFLKGVAGSLAYVITGGVKSVCGVAAAGWRPSFRRKCGSWRACGLGLMRRPRRRRDIFRVKQSRGSSAADIFDICVKKQIAVSYHRLSAK